MPDQPTQPPNDLPASQPATQPDAEPEPHNTKEPGPEHDVYTPVILDPVPGMQP
jgi:hypothetical protein